MNSKGSDYQIDINLLDNGIDFILKGIDNLFGDDLMLDEFIDPRRVLPSNYKYGTLHLFSGFLLLLKERLYRHHTELIFRGDIKDTKAKLANNKVPTTVDLDEALERLEIGPLFNFSKNEVVIIRRIQDYRNKFEHYSVSTNKYELWVNIIKFLDIVDRFLLDQLNIDLGSATNEGQLIEKIRRIESVHDRFLKQQEDEWRKDREIALSNFKRNQRKILDELNYNHFEPFVFCPECGSQTLIAVGDFAGICANEECYAVSPISPCIRCDRPTIAFPWEATFCDECIQYYEMAAEEESIPEYEDHHF